MSVLEGHAWGALGHECARLLESMPKPTLAAINGFALGGGCELALGCDIRYASENARIGQPEIQLAVIPGWGGTQRLARAIGPALAKDLILTGRSVDAAEALRIGLVSAVYPAAELMERVLETGGVPGEEIRGRALGREGRDEPGAPGRPRRRPLVRGDPLRRAVRDRGPEGRHARLRREARAAASRAASRQPTIRATEKAPSSAACVSRLVVRRLGEDDRRLAGRRRLARPTSAVSSSSAPLGLR